MIERALERGDVELVACVRSERAASELPKIPPDRGRVARVDFDKPGTLREAFRRTAGVIHLPGVLVETPGRSYERANVDTVRAAVEAAQAESVAKLVLLSALGADPASANPYFRSKGRAEQLALDSGLACTVLRAPLVLCCASQGDAALARESAGGVAFLIGGGHSREQPVDARDLAEASLSAACRPDAARGRVLDLVGPESVSMRDLVRRAARLRGTRVRVVPLPAVLVKAVLAVRWLFARAGLSPAVIDVMQTDACCDPAPAERALGIRLRPLDATLRYSLGLEKMP